MQERMTIEDLKDLIPYILGVVSTIIALKKDWIAAKLGKKQSAAQLAATEEQVEEHALKNVQATVDIYQRMLTDLEQRFTTQIDSLNLKIDALEKRNEQLDRLVQEQKEFIRKQSASLSYYKKKCAGCPTYEEGKPKMPNPEDAPQPDNTD